MSVVRIREGSFYRKFAIILSVHIIRNCPYLRGVRMERFDCNCHRLLNKPSGYIQQIVATNPLSYMEKKQKQPRFSWQLIRACALRHSGAMTHVLYYIFKMATKTAQIGM